MKTNLDWWFIGQLSSSDCSFSHLYTQRRNYTHINYACMNVHDVCMQSWIMHGIHCPCFCYCWWCCDEHNIDSFHVIKHYVICGCLISQSDGHNAVWCSILVHQPEAKSWEEANADHGPFVYRSLSCLSMYIGILFVLLSCTYTSFAWRDCVCNLRPAWRMTSAVVVLIRYKSGKVVAYTVWNCFLVKIFCLFFVTRNEEK